MHIVYKFEADGISEKVVPTIDLDGWLAAGWTLELPPTPEPTTNKKKAPTIEP